MKAAIRQYSGNIPVTIVNVNTISECVVRRRSGGGGLTEAVPLRIVQGELHNGCFAEKIPFTGFHDLVMKLDVLLDHLAFPQRDTALRSFGKNGIRRYHQMKEDLLPRLEQPWNERVMQEGWGSCATFSVHVYARQNSSWQGTVRWLEAKEERKFRSVLELSYLLESALDLGPENQTSV